MFNPQDLLTLLPELFLTAAACLVLLFDVFLTDDQRDATHWVALLALVVTIYLVIQGQPAETVTAFGGMFVRDHMAEILKVTVLIATILMFVMARAWLKDRKLFVGEFYSLAMFSVLGAMLLVSAGNLITVYLGLELFSLPAYALVAMNRESKLSSEAAIKFFVLGALASGLLLFGMSLIYGATGTLDLHQIFAAAGTTQQPHLLQFGLVFLVVGIGFEFGAVPFHMWLPDVYEGAPTPIAMYISAVPKLAAIGLAYRLLEVGLGPYAGDWRVMLAIMAALSLVVGNVVAIAQTNFKRMLAYSTISHMGFVFLALSNPTPEGYASALFYAVCFALMETAAFGVILALARKGFECEMISDLKGLNHQSPWMAGVMAIAMFSLAGIPPLWGFMAKVEALKAAIDGGMLWLAIIAIICSIIGLFYYLRIVWVMYFNAPAEGREPVSPKPDFTLRWLLSINGLGLIAMIGFSGLFYSWCLAAFGA
ncbi:MAG TPA: NADH-quinone oxidoreductase subunit NuoN [Rhodanobacteraceae bacterium]|nr:NADH-quinone oxidoreductase subunit NuoN [Rhodanobacteraceae bacterium]